MSSTALTNSPTGPKLDSVRAFALMLDISVSGAWRILQTDPDAPRPLKVGSRVRLKRADVEEYINVLVERAQKGQQGKSADVRLAEYRWRQTNGCTGSEAVVQGATE